LLGDEYRLLFDAYLGASSRLVSDGWLNRKPMDVLVDEHLRGARDHGNRLWLLLNSEIWYRVYILGQDRLDLRHELHGLKNSAGLPARELVRAS
jgi:hypothetical protein